MRQKLNLITLGVTDFAKAVDFYENGLGWKKSSASVEELALFPLGESFLHCTQEMLSPKMLLLIPPERVFQESHYRTMHGAKQK